MKNGGKPRVRVDLEFFPVRHGEDQLVLIQDHLGLVEEGRAVSMQVYEIMALLDGTRTIQDVQMLLMRKEGGLLIDSEAVEALVDRLDETFLIESDRYREARESVIAEFARMEVRPCSHCGRSYPGEQSYYRYP